MLCPLGQGKEIRSWCRVICDGELVKSGFRGIVRICCKSGSFLQLWLNQSSSGDDAQAEGANPGTQG